MTNTTNKEYKGVFKSTFLFSFVQVIRLMAGIVKNKVAAMILGPSGMGIMGVFNTTINFLKTGAGLGVVAMMTNTFFLLPIICLLFVVEAGSSLLQIISKKFFGRKIFISAPIHHHLQAKGWEESKIVMRFWVIGGVMALIGIFMAMQGVITG